MRISSHSNSNFVVWTKYKNIGEHTRSLGSESKKIILKLLDEEFSYAKIANITDVSKSCISGL